MKLTSYDAPVEQVYGSTNPQTVALWEGLEAINEWTPHSLFHLTSHWPCYVPRISVIRFLAHYELFKLVQDMPGDIVELGVSRGISFFSWCKFLEIFNATDTSRKVIGFDSFEGLADFTVKDGADAARDDKRVGGWSAEDAEQEIFRLNELHNADNVCAKVRGILVKGRVQDTLNGVVNDLRPGMRISLLHFDLDLYEPTLFALNTLYDLVIPGGVVVFDEYALPPWAGEAMAWDEFAAARGIKVWMNKLPWSLTPNAYFIKD